MTNSVQLHARSREQKERMNMTTAAVSKQTKEDVVPEVLDVMMELANVEASLGGFVASRIETRLDLYGRREELVRRLASLNALDLLGHAYGWAECS